MFSNLPGKVTNVREPHHCEFEQSGNFEIMKEIIDANKASDALKLQYAKGKDWHCESQATTRIQGETGRFVELNLHRTRKAIDELHHTYTLHNQRVYPVRGRV